MIVGHERVQNALASPSLGNILLFTGPASVGKWTMAEHLARQRGVNPVDVIRVSVLSMGLARELVSQMQYPGAYGPRQFIIRIDGAQDTVLNSLLVSLENSTRNRIVLISSSEVIPTLGSRAQTFQFYLLSSDEVETILRRRKFGEVEARKLAQASGGQVRTALAMADNSDVRVTVLAAVNAIMERSSETLDTIALKWGEEHSLVMQSLCTEVITKRWRLFQPAEAETMTPKTALGLLTVLNSKARPRLLVRYGFASVMGGDR